MAAALIALSVIPSQSQEKTFTEKMFPAGVSFDAYATATFGDIDSLNLDSAELGGGIGVNAFVTKNFGIGLEANASTPESGTFLDEANAKAILRLPITVLAPQAFAGAGYQFATDDVDVFAGAGGEIKVSKNASVFADARYVYVPQLDEGYPMVRAGLRFNF